VIVTSNTALGGHVEVGEHAVIGGQVGIHQFVRVGAFSMTAASTFLRKDVLPYAMIAGEPAHHYRLNTIGLRRKGIGGDSYRALEKMYRALRDGQMCPEPTTLETEYLANWLRQPSKRGLSGFQK
jgi:UDP-N-acetylglucosamine acyltransferase